MQNRTNVYKPAEQLKVDPVELLKMINGVPFANVINFQAVTGHIEATFTDRDKASIVWHMNKSLAKELLPYLETLGNIQYLLMHGEEGERIKLMWSGDQALRSMVDLVNADLARFAPASRWHSLGDLG